MPDIAFDETALVAALRDGDERAFAQLVDQHGGAMLRIARGYVASREVAEDVVQETWIALFRGIEKFEGRSSVRTWLFSVLINIAKSRGIRDRRDGDALKAAVLGTSVDPARFRPSNDPDWPGHWRDDAEPTPFPESPEGSLLHGELVDCARRAMDELPERQRIVVTMRDMLGMDSEEVSALLDISLGNQRVLLHRGRSVVRAALEIYLERTT